MPDPTLFHRQHEARSRNRVALRHAVTGLALGALVWALAQRPSAGGLQLAMALVLLVAGTASSVCFALATAPHVPGGASVVKRAYQGTMCVCCGVLASIHLLNWLAH